jgi:rhodanese-related sulfurtransferase
MTLATPARITASEIKRRLDQGEPVFIIDTRSPAAWEASGIKIPGAHRIHYSEMEKHLGEIPRDRLIITYCT